MKIRKQIFAVLMTVVMILTLMPVMAFAEGESEPVPTDAWYEGALFAEIGDTDMEGMYYTDGGSAVCVRYTDDETEPPTLFIYGEYKYTDEDGVKQTREGYLKEGADPSKDESYAFAYIDYDKFKPIKAGANNIPMLVEVPYGIDPETGWIKYKDFYYTRRYWASQEKPIKVQFIPAAGFKLKGTIGYNYLDEEDFYGKGNIFRVSYEEPVDPTVFPDNPSPMVITVDYKYVKASNSVKGFYDNGNPEYDRFDLLDGVECYLKKGLNKGVVFTYKSYVKGLSRPVKLPFKVNVYASKYGLYGKGLVSTYTGKAITKPRFRIYNTDDNLVPSRELTYTTPRARSIGWHNLRVRVKSAYKNKYNTSSIVITYGIGPATPKLAKLAAGKGSMLVYWGMPTAAQMKNIDGFCIELATNKRFTKNYKKIRINKNAVKSGKKYIKGLARGRYYFVRLTAYKNVRQKNGVSYRMPSRYSKVLYRKTK